MADTEVHRPSPLVRIEHHTGVHAEPPLSTARSVAKKKKKEKKKVRKTVKTRILVTDTSTASGQTDSAFSCYTKPIQAPSEDETTVTTAEYTALSSSMSSPTSSAESSYPTTAGTRAACTVPRAMVRNSAIARGRCEAMPAKSAAAGKYNVVDDGKSEASSSFSTKMGNLANLAAGYLNISMDKDTTSAPSAGAEALENSRVFPDEEGSGNTQKYSNSGFAAYKCTTTNGSFNSSRSIDGGSDPGVGSSGIGRESMVKVRTQLQAARAQATEKLNLACTPRQGGFTSHEDGGFSEVRSDPGAAMIQDCHYGIRTLQDENLCRQGRNEQISGGSNTRDVPGLRVNVSLDEHLASWSDHGGSPMTPTQTNPSVLLTPPASNRSSCRPPLSTAFKNQQQAMRIDTQQTVGAEGKVFFNESPMSRMRQLTTPSNHLTSSMFTPRNATAANFEHQPREKRVSFSPVGEEDFDDAPQSNSNEDYINDKHRKWRMKQIQMEKENEECKNSIGMEYASVASDKNDKKGQDERFNATSEESSLQTVPSTGVDCVGLNAANIMRSVNPGSLVPVGPVTLLQNLMSKNCVSDVLSVDSDDYTEDDDTDDDYDDYDDETTYFEEENNEGMKAEEETKYETADNKVSRGRSQARSNAPVTLEDGLDSDTEAETAKTEITENTSTSRNMAQYFVSKSYKNTADSSSERVPVSANYDGNQSVDDSTLAGEGIVSDCDQMAAAGEPVIHESPVPDSAAPVPTTIKKKEKKKNKSKKKDKDRGKGGSSPEIVLDKNFLQIFVREIALQGIPLVWHKVQNSQCYMRPASIRMFLKLDRAQFSEPMLVWDPLAGQEDSASFDVAGGETARRGHLSLFDVKSVDKAGNMNLHSYPFAIPGNSLLVSMNNGDTMLFETKNEIERQRLVLGIRWVVARLSFQIVLGSKEICSELLYYANTGAQVDNKTISSMMGDITNIFVDKVRL